MNFIYPNDYVDDVYLIDFEDLASKGYKGVLFDVDNTLVPFDVLEADERLIALFDKLHTLGLKPALVSNNNRERVAALNEGLGVPIVPNAMKPLTYKLKAILKEMGVAHDQGIFVGDQLFTDVWVGNKLGLYTILVKPIQKKEQHITRVKRSTERLVLKGYKKKAGK